MTRFLKILAWLAVFAAALFIGHQNATASYWPGTEQPALEAKLPTHMQVYCATVDYPGAAGWTWLEAREIYLSAQTCKDLADGNFSYAYLVLYHEWWHQAFQERNETLTQQGAITIYRYALRHYWHFDAYKAQAFYDGLWMLSWPTEYVPTGHNSVDPLLPSVPTAPLPPGPGPDGAGGGKGVIVDPGYGWVQVGR